MNNLQNLLTIAKQEVGYSHKAGSNKTKYGNNPESWSGNFVDWCFEKSNIDKINVSNIEEGIKEIKKNNKFRTIQTDKTGPQPGDIVFLSFNGVDKNGEINHVGICIKNLGNGIVSTIEGNTCDNSKDNQRQGGLVLKKIRAWNKNNYKKINCSIVGWYRVDNMDDIFKVELKEQNSVNKGKSTKNKSNTSSTKKKELMEESNEN